MWDGDRFCLQKVEQLRQLTRVIKGKCGVTFSMEGIPPLSIAFETEF